MDKNKTTKSHNYNSTVAKHNRAASSNATSRHSSPSFNEKMAAFSKKLNKLNAGIVHHIKKFLIDRWDNLQLARHDVVVWLSLVLLIIAVSFLQIIWYNQQTSTSAPIAGGTYAEGVVDKLTTISPLYASTDTEKAASQLVYPGLLSYDSSNKLKGQLAQSWSSDDSGKIWTVRLKPSARWSDGKQLTADDVVFTVGLMKNKSINQTLANSWQTIKASVKSTDEVQFQLENAYMSFPTALTFGVLPKHILDGKSPMEISNLFTKSPTSIVGAGPFRFDRTESNGTKNSWVFAANKQYHGAKPKIDRVIIRTYGDTNALAEAIKRGEINAASGVKISDISTMSNGGAFKTIQVKTADGVYALINSDGEITGNQTIRDALRLATDRNQIRRDIILDNKSLASPAALNGPIATDVYKSIDAIKQPDYNQDQAKQLLDQAGWTISDGQKYRQKDGQTLTLSVVTLQGTNYEAVARQIVSQWQNIGIDAKLTVASPAEIQQGYLVPRNYDVLVYQMHLGSDPDVYAYWSSTQTNETGLNLSNYTSRRAEIALSAGRVNPDANAREARYVAFVNQWMHDTPAIALYQPNLYYVVSKDIETLKSGDSVIDASNRYRGITDWTVLRGTVHQTP